MSEATITPTERPGGDEERRLLPVEVEVYIEADGAVTFADPEAGMLPVARELNPDQPLACDVPPQGEPPAGDG